MRYTASQTFTDPKHARAWLLEQEVAISRRDWTPPSKTAPVPVVTEFEPNALMRVDARLAPNVRPLKVSKAELYKKLIRLELAPAFGGLDLADITPARVEQWHTESQRRGHKRVLLLSQTSFGRCRACR